MKLAVLGAKWSPPAPLTDQTVVPPVGLPSASAQVNAAPPQSCTSMPRCLLYQARSASGSFALKKIPPMPVTLFMPRSCSSSRGSGIVRRYRGRRMSVGGAKRDLPRLAERRECLLIRPSHELLEIRSREAGDVDD